MEKKEIIAPDLLEILACPVCKGDIELTEHQPGRHGLKCLPCKKIYPIKEGIPVMLPDEALPLDEK